MAGRAIAVLWLCGGWLLACSFDKSEHPQFCKTSDDCEPSATCIEGFCVEQDGGMSEGDAGGDGSAIDCAETGQAEPCYEGAAGTADQGVCRPGERLCIGGAFTQCLGQVLPEAEDCNGRDDDCDGEVDEIDSSSCETAMQGVCGEGRLACRGSIAVCENVNAPETEVCNELDDDCDGEVDETAAGECYPADTDGCRESEDSFQCLGLCSPGATACEDGEQSCSGAVVPTEEACASAATAADEDCDGKVDEGCSCEDDDTRPCYAGPGNTVMVGTCRAGTQRCVGDAWDGACDGQVLPSAETCANQGQDNDCDGDMDDVPGLGAECIDDGEQGLCRFGTIECGQSAQPRCATQDPTAEVCDPLDHSCDGNPYDGFDFTSEETCGDCDTSCEDGEMCCEGGCHDSDFFDRDSENCGRCGNPCGEAEYCCQGQCLRTADGAILPILGGGNQDPPECDCDERCGSGQVCCGTSCVDLESDPENCGLCGNVCPGGLFSEAACQDGVCGTQ